MHEVDFHRRAQKQLKRLPKDRQIQIAVAVRELAGTADPTLHRNVAFLRGHEDADYRLRVGEYRVLFELSEIEKGKLRLLIFVTTIGARGDLY